MAWATLAQFKANQVNLATTGDPLITLSLNATGAQITACLYSGGYSPVAMAAAVVAGTAVYDLLVLLNIRLAALDLMAGGGVSARSGAKERTFLGWQKSTAAVLETVCSGQAAISNSGTGADIAPPQASLSGFASDTREAGIDLIDPLLWDEVDPVDADYTETEV